MREQLVRSSIVLSISLFICSTPSASEACEEITTSNKAYCSLIKFCQTLADAEAKEECNRLAEEMNPNKQEADTETSQLPANREADTAKEPTAIPSVPLEESDTEQTAPPDREVPVISEEVQLPTETPRETNVPERNLISESITIDTDETESDPLSVRNAFSRLENKRRFAAAIIYYREVGFKSAVLVLSNGLVFRSDYSALFKPEIGDVVNVRRRSVLSTVTYNLVGGRGGAMEVIRQRCEVNDMKQATRRLCNLGQRVLDERSKD